MGSGRRAFLLWLMKTTEPILWVRSLPCPILAGQAFSAAAALGPTLPNQPSQLGKCLLLYVSSTPPTSHGRSAAQVMSRTKVTDSFDDSRIKSAD